MRRRTFIALGAVGVAGVLGGAEEIKRHESHPHPKSLSQTAAWGAYAPPEPYPNCRPHYALETLVQAKLPYMSWFVSWSADFPAAAVQANSHGYKLLIAWMPIHDGSKAVPFADILAGKWDAYINRFLVAAKNYGYPVTIRFAHEMNLGKHAWSVGNGGAASTQEFIDTWCYLYKMKQSIGASNTHLLWCISTADGAIPAEQYFPGLDAIDYVGFDAYSGFTSTGWTEPVKLLTPSYRRLAKLAPERDIWLCEIGCRETTTADVARGHSKAKWIADLFALQHLPSLTHIMFFNRDKEQDWRVNSSPGALSAVQAGLKSRPTVQ